MTSIDKHIAIKIKKKRKEAGYSQEELGGILGLTRTSIINLETGRHGFSVRNIFILCSLFKCTPNDLFPKIPRLNVDKAFKTVVIKKTVIRRVIKSNATQLIKSIK